MHDRTAATNTIKEGKRVIRRKSQSSLLGGRPGTGIRKRSEKGSRRNVAPPGPRIPPLGTPVGSRITSGDDKGCYVVGYRDRIKGHPFFRTVLMPHELRLATTYVIDFKHTRFVCFQTTQPDGAIVAWDTCRRCHRHVQNCVCQEIKPPDYILNWMPKKSIVDELSEKIDQIEKHIRKKKVMRSTKKLIRKK